VGAGVLAPPHRFFDPSQHARLLRAAQPRAGAPGAAVSGARAKPRAASPVPAAAAVHAHDLIETYLTALIHLSLPERPARAAARPVRGAADDDEALATRPHRAHTLDTAAAEADHALAKTTASPRRRPSVGAVAELPSVPPLPGSCSHLAYERTRLP